MPLETVRGAPLAVPGGRLIFTPAVPEPRPGAWRTPPVARGIAFFDMDDTLLCAHSAYLYIRECWRTRFPTWREWLAFTLVSGIYSTLNLPLFVMNAFHRLAGGAGGKL